MLMTLATSLPVIGSAIAFLKEKTRLVVEYALITLVIGIAGFTFALWLSNKDTEKSLAESHYKIAELTGRISSAEEINKHQEETIDLLKELRLKDAKALAGLLMDYKAVSEKDSDARLKLLKLGEKNEEVRKYLNLSIPSDLLCLLNNTCQSSANERAYTGEVGAPSGIIAAVPAPAKPDPDCN